jgi:lycopene cyclase domain-containing protein
MIGLGYTLPAVLSVLAVCAWELLVLRTGLFRKPAYWISMAIMLGFQIPVDGWLTKLSAPIVRYVDEHTLGVRFPWDIPVEDFLFGFSLITAVLLLWEHQQRHGTRKRRERAWAPGAHETRPGVPQETEAP